MKRVKLSIILIAFVYLMTGCKDTKKEEQITKEKTSEEIIVENQIKEFLEGYRQKDEKISEKRLIFTRLVNILNIGLHMGWQMVLFTEMLVT